MNNKLDALIVKLEADALATPGVVGLGEGLSKSGKPCLKLLVDIPPEKFVLPELLNIAEIEIEYIGQINAE
ncbi:hypothetical protein DXX93_11910 [Thalassotalea euphylliae]|uniref:Uncharacterized protein n=1 Tax=Thalassotalea euphylliae TaxID=1655234 RepID=A0A3E0TTA0_9GAMM|nr:hypothetical protein [Thalassotalea euphylliae]REL27202.1 hypothetical protein DXX93_11910 [Thalassotalea euphylliae]